MYKMTYPNKSDDDPVIIGPDLNSSRSATDKKLYRQIMLANGLRCVLISDTIALRQQENSLFEQEYESTEDESSSDESENKKDDNSDEESEEEDDEEGTGLRNAAAAMVVGAGSYYDPEEVQGLAHFLEHMLFMGTSKYPVENAYDSFISSNGGSDNAYTELEYTLYHFEIPQEKFFEALDMFSQFFVDPLLLPDAVEREMNAIESEFQLNVNSDGCRWQELLCFSSKVCKGEQQHPFGKFSWGNLQSLRDTPSQQEVNVMDELRRFYEQYYYAANQRLVVIGAYSLDELQSQVEKCFSDIPAQPRQESTSLKINHVNPLSWTDSQYLPSIAAFGMPFPPESLARIYRIVPIKERHSLSITWQLPPAPKNNWKSKPEHIISHLLGHESKGSLLSSLKMKGWVTSCSAGISSDGHDDASSHRLFNMSFELSETGIDRYNDIISHVYVYIGMLRFYCESADGLPDFIFNELKATAEASFKFDDEPSPEDLVEIIAEKIVPINDIPPERLLDADDLYFEKDYSAIQFLLKKFFIPSNARYDIASSSFGAALSTDDDAIKSDKTFLPCSHFDNKGFAHQFSNKSEPPQVEPMFGTKFWCHCIHEDFLARWTQDASPSLPPCEFQLALPPVNPYVPESFDIKPLPDSDRHHPLVNCSLKVCVSVGKSKAWFPATCTTYNHARQSLLLVYEDLEEVWHSLDINETDNLELNVGYEGTFDKKKTKFKVISLPTEQGCTLRFGDDSDFDVEDGLAFPLIPPPQSASRLPRKIVDRKDLQLWFLQDRKFCRPIGEFRMRVMCADANKTPLNRAVQQLFVALVRDALVETTYLAEVTELSSSISSNDVGFTIRVYGFDNKLLDLVKQILKTCMLFRNRAKMKSLPDGINDDRFDACLETLRRAYRNDSLKAKSQVSTIRLQCIRKNLWSAHSKLEALNEITITKFNSILDENLKYTSVEAFLHGNFNEKNALLAESIIVDAMKSSSMTGGLRKYWPYQEVFKVPCIDNNLSMVLPTKNFQEPNTSVEVYFQISKDDAKTRAIIDLINHILYEPMYDQLRTKEQFGYDVGCGSRWTFGVIGTCFKVTTSNKSADEIVSRIEKFLQDYRNDLENMPKEEYLGKVIGLAKSKLLMNDSLEEECSSFWDKIIERTYNWEENLEDAIQLRGLTKADVIEAYEKYFLPMHGGTANKRRRLVIQVIGVNEGPASDNRPVMSPDIVPAFIDDTVKSVHESSRYQTWGKLFS